MTLDGLTLPDLLWQQYGDWSPIYQTLRQSATGSLLRMEYARGNIGRPIQLRSGPLLTGEQVAALAEKLTADREMTLVMPQGTYSVIWQHGAIGIGGGAGPLVAHPMFQIADPGTDTVYSVEINLLVIE